MSEPGFQQVSFIVRLWLEESAGCQSWRGRVVEVNSEIEGHIQDGAGLIRFISGELMRLGGAAFPFEISDGRSSTGSDQSSQS